MKWTKLKWMMLMIMMIINIHNMNTLNNKTKHGAMILNFVIGHYTT